MPGEAVIQRRLRTTPCALLLAFAASCTDVINPNCTDIAVMPISVTVRDADTGAGIASGATLVLESAGYKDSVAIAEGWPSLDDRPLYVDSSVERPGVYGVTVRRPNYLPWDTTGVSVSAGECHVRPKALIASLEPAP